MARKLQEFLHLQQGLSSVYEYSKKMLHFYQGLSPTLREHLTLFRGFTLNELVSTFLLSRRMRVMLPWRRRGGRDLYLGLTGVLHPSTA
jgi:hypothetical protein